MGDSRHDSESHGAEVHGYRHATVTAQDGTGTGTLILPEHRRVEVTPENDTPELSGRRTLSFYSRFLNWKTKLNLTGGILQ